MYDLDRSETKADTNTMTLEGHRSTIFFGRSVHIGMCIEKLQLNE
jgi:hypothetical protein